MVRLLPAVKLVHPHPLAFDLILAELGTVGDQEHRAPLAQAPHGLRDGCHAERIQIGRWLVEDDQRGVHQERSGKRDPPTLAG